MTDKYDLDYFDDDLSARRASEYRRTYRRPSSINRGTYPPQGRRPAPNGQRNIHRPTSAPRRKKFSKRLRNRIIIVSVGIIILLLIITIITSMFRACTGAIESKKTSATASTSPTQPSTQAATQSVNSTQLNFVTPNIADDNSMGYMGNNAYIWKEAAFELFGGDEFRAQLYADAINSYQQKLGNSVKVYNMVVPNHTEMGLPQRLKSGAAPSDSQAENIKQIYSKLNNSVYAVNCYNKLAEHCGEYIYYNSDHHWTGLGAYYAYTAFAETTNQTPLDLTTCTENKISGFTGSFSNTNDGLSSDTVSYWTFPYTVTMDITDSSGTTANYSTPYYEYAEAGANTYGVFIMGDNPLTVLHSSSENGAGKKIAVIKESYGNAFAPYLTYNYSEVHVIDFRYFTQNLAEYCRQNGITDVLYLNGIMSANTQVQLDSMDSLLN